MIRRFLFCCAAAGSLFGSCATSVAVTKDVDIVVTHSAGSLLTTYTIKETSGKNQPTGSVYIAGQAFRRGDLPPGTYPVFRDATTHTPLVQQLDEIATRRENGDDGSIRHLVFSVQLPAIPANNTYTMEVVRQSGTYSATGKQTLAGLAGAHDLKVDFTDVRNQSGNVRDSGHITFRVNDNISNVGRDAPIRVATGPVRDSWIVRGVPVYATSNNKDPLLYVNCYIDITTNPADQTSIGPVRHVCRVDNSWMNVAAGSVGNSGAPGPAGFTNDPQAISYRPQLLDGATSVLNWGWLDGAVAPSALNVSTGVWTIPQSSGNNAWFNTQPVLYTNSGGTAPAGMTSGQLYFAKFQESPWDTTKITLYNSPFRQAAITPSTQGSGTHNFAFRVWHTHFQSWYTLDQSGKENWTSGGSNAFLPAFTPSEKLYWKQTGTIPPLRTTVTPTDPTSYSQGKGLNNIYAPLSRMNVIGDNSGGSRSDLGLVSEYASQAFLVGDAATWQRARLFALAGSHYFMSTLLNERTGRIPALNNGPPAANHGGSGASYPGLGAPIPGVWIGDLSSPPYIGVAPSLENIPISPSNGGYAGGIWGAGLNSIDHFPAFHNMVYTFLGSRHYLDAAYFAGNQVVDAVFPAGDQIGRQIATVDGVTYYGLHVGCCQRRGSFWAHRDKAFSASFGGDNNPERTYFNDMLAENFWYKRAFEAQYDGGTTNFRDSIATPNVYIPTDHNTFMDAYGAQTSYQAYATLRDPLAKDWLDSFVKTYNGLCSDTAPGHLSSYYCAIFHYDAAIHDSRTVSNFPSGAVGPGYNGSGDASDHGVDAGLQATPYRLESEGTVTKMPGGDIFTFTNGDMVKADLSCSGQPQICWDVIDELVPSKWYVINNVNNADPATFKIINPDTNTPFTSFHVGGTPYTSYVSLKLRPQFAPSTGWHANDYAPYAQSILYGLKNLGFSTINAAVEVMTRRGFIEPGPTQTWLNWDPEVVVP
jgi:hypothetical protein